MSPSWKGLVMSVVSCDMDDFLSYVITGYGPIKTGDRCRDGYSVSVLVTFDWRRRRNRRVPLRPCFSRGLRGNTMES